MSSCSLNTHLLLGHLSVHLSQLANQSNPYLLLVEQVRKTQACPALDVAGLLDSEGKTRDGTFPTPGVHGSFWESDETLRASLQHPLICTTFCIWFQGFTHSLKPTWGDLEGPAVQQQLFLLRGQCRQGCPRTQPPSSPALPSGHRLSSLHSSPPRLQHLYLTNNQPWAQSSSPWFPTPLHLSLFFKSWSLLHRLVKILVKMKAVAECNFYRRPISSFLSPSSMNT